jgi:hypothetical protein
MTMLLEYLDAQRAKTIPPRRRSRKKAPTAM